METNMNWVCLRLYDYSVDKNYVLKEIVFPLMLQLQKKKIIDGYYFERHWHLGPHIRIFLYKEDGDLQSSTFDLVKTKLSEALGDKCAKRKKVDEAKYIRIQKEAAWRENNREGVFDKLKADLTILKTNDHLSDQYWGGKKGRQVAENYLIKTSKMIENLLYSDVNGNDKVTVAFQLMVAFGCVMDKTYERSHITFRSHVEGFLAQIDQPQKFREYLEQKFTDQSQLLLALFKETEKSIIDGDMGLVDNYVYILKQTKQIIIDSLQQNELISMNLNKYMESVYSKIESDQEYDLKYEQSEYYARFDEEKMLSFMDGNDHFKALRLTVNLLYLNFSQLGLTPIERFSICWLFYRTVEKRCNFNSDEVIKKWVEKIEVMDINHVW